MSKFYNAPVVGVDVAADFSVATILAPDGSIYKKAFRFEHDAKGFLYFLEIIKKQKRFLIGPVQFSWRLQAYII